ncbi:MAG: hypothetical protein J1E80_06585 [Desulfovibrionaceae bacterium]|nr:hypothetical protein [Desulfovibrionaceae bacterium]
MEQYKKGIVCFLDILGTKNTNNFDMKYKIHKIWHTETHKVEKRENLPGRSRALKRKVYSFSDCAYFTYEFKDGNCSSPKNYKRILRVLTTLLVPIQLIMLEGFLVRGGITCGDYFVDELGIFGPAIELAYVLESSYAIYPRIIIDDYFGNILFDIQKKMYFKNFIIKDHDFYFINPFYRIGEYNKLGTTKFTRKIFFDKLESQANKMLNNNKNEKVKVKWRWISELIKKEHKLEESKRSNIPHHRTVPDPS